jgi:hydrogenase nickel incorporation protein HypB
MSTTEGEDKPLKYPAMFRKAQAMVLNKIDLLPYLPYDAEQAVAFARQVNPGLEVFRASCTTGEGIEAFAGWLLARAAARVGR